MSAVCPHNFSFTAEERIRNKASFDTLFSQGHSINIYPLRMVYLLSEQQDVLYPAQVGFSVPKRLFKKAVDRNRLKRRMREAYRISKPGLYTFLTAKKQNLLLVFVFLNKEELPYRDILRLIKTGLKRLETL